MLILDIAIGVALGLWAYNYIAEGFAIRRRDQENGYVCPIWRDW